MPLEVRAALQRMGGDAAGKSERCAVGQRLVATVRAQHVDPQAERFRSTEVALARRRVLARC
jgi:hypothetical protein